MTTPLMNPWMVCLELPPFNEDMEAVIPAQRTRVNQLFMDGILLSYSVSAQRDAIWCVILAVSEGEAMKVIASLPIHAWSTDATVHQLLFYNAMPSANLPVSLN